MVNTTTPPEERPEFLSLSSPLSITLVALQSATILAQVLLWVYEGLFASISTRFTKILPALSHLARRGLFVVLPSCWGLKVAFYTVQALQEPRHTLSSCSSLSIDQDVTGVGVRAALYISGGVSALTAVTGHFHGEISGVCELNSVLWLSVLTYIINLGKSYFINLEPVNILLGTLMLDAYISALSMNLAMKDCLTEKWRIVSIIALQASGIILEAAAIATISRVRKPQQTFSEPPECTCFAVFWWGSINTCTGASFTFWFYFCLRTLSWSQEAWLAACYTNRYSRAKKARSNVSTVVQSQHDQISPCVYDSIPATAFSSYLLSLFSFVSTCLSIEVSLRAHHRQENVLLRTWGQTAQLIAALWIVYRWIQTFCEMFKSKAVEERRAILARCSIGSRIPKLGSTDTIGSCKSAWEKGILKIRRVIRNHPFGSLPPRRPSDHARFCSVNDGWQRIQLDFRQWPIASEDEKGQLLHVGATQGDKVLVSNLLSESAPVNFVGTDGRTALRISIDMGHSSITSLLLAGGADPNVSDSAKKTPIHIVIERCDEDAVRTLLAKGADPSLADIYGWQGPHFAALHGQAKIMSLLLLTSVNPNAKDNLGRTALHLLVRFGHEDMVDFLASKSDPNVLNNKGKSPLYLAARHNREHAAKALLKNGANPDIAEYAQGWTPLHACARHARGKIAMLLLESGCNTSIIAEKFDKKTALSLAVNFGRERIVDDILRFQTDLDAVDYKNRTALFFAAKDDRDATRKLLRKGAKVNAGESSALQNLLTKYGVTDEEAKSLIAEENHVKILDLLEKK